MDEGDTVHMILKVIRQSNRTQYDTYSRQNVPIFDCVMDLRTFLLANYAEELPAPADVNSFRLGYIVGKNRRLTISTSANLERWLDSAMGGSRC